MHQDTKKSHGKVKELTISELEKKSLFRLDKQLDL